MKWYFACRMRHLETIKEVCNALSEAGEKIVSTWVYEKSLKPYEENREEVAQVARNVVRDVSRADVFVLLSDKEGTDMFVELGIALAVKQSANPDMRIYIAGPYSKRSLMHLHPDATHTETTEEVFQKEGISGKHLEGVMFEY